MSFHKYFTPMLILFFIKTLFFQKKKPLGYFLHLIPYLKTYVFIAKEERVYLLYDASSLSIKKLPRAIDPVAAFLSDFDSNLDKLIRLPGQIFNPAREEFFDRIPLGLTMKAVAMYGSAP